MKLIESSGLEIELAFFMLSFGKEYTKKALRYEEPLAK